MTKERDERMEEKDKIIHYYRKEWNGKVDSKQPQ